MPSGHETLDRARRAGAHLEQAALLESDYSRAFEGAKQILGARSFYMARLRADGSLDFLADDDARDPISEYRTDGWEGRDTWSRYARSGTRNGALVTDSMLVPYELRARDPFFQEYCRKWGLGHYAAWRTSLFGETWVNTLIRPTGVSFSIEEQAALETLRAAADRAALLACSFRNVHAKGIAEGLERSGRPSLVLDQVGRVIFATGRVERLLDTAFAIRQGRLCGFDALTETNFESLRSAIVGRALRLPPAFSITSPSLELPVIAVPMTLHDDFRPTLPGAAALLMLIDINDRPRTPIGILQVALSLTQREAELAVILGQGASTAEAAERLGLKVSSARQLQKALLAKTGCSRQSQLVTKIQRLAMATCSEERVQ